MTASHPPCPNCDGPCIPECEEDRAARANPGPLAYRHDGGAGGVTLICADCHATRPDSPEEAEAQGLDPCEAMEWDAVAEIPAGAWCEICDVDFSPVVNL